MAVKTGGGMHFLIRREKIKFDPKHLIQKIEEILPDAKEVVRNKNEMIPMPGTFQYGVPVEIWNKEDFV